MRFIDEATRNRDPLARLIPQTVFYSSYFFDGEFDEISAAFMVDPALGLKKFLNSAHNFFKRHNYWMATVYAHPNRPFQELINIARNMELSIENVLTLTATWGNLDFFIHIISLYKEHYSLDVLFSIWVLEGFLPFCFAAKYGHLEILRYLLHLAPHLMEAMYSGGNYKALHLAWENRQEKVIHYLLSYPKVFAYAELSLKFNEFIESFAAVCLGRLYKKKREFQSPHFNLVFDLNNEEEIQLYLRIGYYLLEHEELEQRLVNDMLFLVFSLPSVVRALRIDARNPAKRDEARIALALKLVARFQEREAIQGLISCKIPNLNPDISERLLGLAALSASRDRFFQPHEVAEERVSNAGISYPLPDRLSKVLS